MANLEKGLAREVRGGQAAAAPLEAAPSQAAPPSIDPPPVQGQGGNSFDEFLNWFSE